MPSFQSSGITQPRAQTSIDFLGGHFNNDCQTKQLSLMPFVGHFEPHPVYRCGRSEDLGNAKKSPIVALGPPYPPATESYGYSSSSHLEPIYNMLPSNQASNVSLKDTTSLLQIERKKLMSQCDDNKIGGVAAFLDYEMKEMVDFVSQITQQMYEIYTSTICLADIDMSRSVMNSKTQVHPDFRKFVSQILSSTRLPSSTILIGLYYLAQRMTGLSTLGRYCRGSTEIYQMLTVALLLGSKFLDDNTFQNRSWSEVSNISVNDINILEIEWLVDISWKMHVDPCDPGGIQLWRSHWDHFQARKFDRSLAKSLDQTLIKTYHERESSSYRHSVSTTSFPFYPRGTSREPESKTSHPRWNNSFHEHWLASRIQAHYSPPSAPESGPATPHLYSNHEKAFCEPMLPPSFAIQTSVPLQPAPPLGLQGAFATPFDPQIRKLGHGNHLDHNYCLSDDGYYHTASAFGFQLVAG